VIIRGALLKGGQEQIMKEVKNDVNDTFTAVFII